MNETITDGTQVWYIGDDDNVFFRNVRSNRTVLLVTDVMVWNGSVKPNPPLVSLRVQHPTTGENWTVMDHEVEIAGFAR